VDAVGFEPLFALSLACGLVAVGLWMGLGEPRENQAAA
jgi:hypothetical protein